MINLDLNRARLIPSRPEILQSIECALARYFNQCTLFAESTLHNLGHPLP